MHELTVNLHMHSTYSDGTGTHAEIVAAAQQAGLDALIITDHNVLVQGLEGYYEEGDRRVLLLIGEEVHDQSREPQKNHLLVFGAGREMASLAYDPQILIDGIIKAGGVAFLAHPIDAEAPHFAEQDLSWVSWDVQNYTGIELWNSMTEFKSLLKNRLHALFYALNFKHVAHGPFPETLKKWDELTTQGQTVAVVGGSDAHQLLGRMGPISKVLFPYAWHFGAINTHVLIPKPLSGDLSTDRKMLINALRAGHTFVGYDLPGPTRGFRFTGHCKDGIALMGDTVSAKEGVTLQIKLPERQECHLLKDGKSIRSSTRRETMMHKVSEAGVYRVEVYRRYKGQRRGWIFSNPIYVR